MHVSPPFVIHFVFFRFRLLRRVVQKIVVVSWVLLCMHGSCQFCLVQEVHFVAFGSQLCIYVAFEAGGALRGEADNGQLSALPQAVDELESAGKD